MSALAQKDDEIYEVGDAGVDVSEPVFTEHLRHKESGNTSFSASDFSAALNHYTKALELCPSDQTVFKAVVHSNRAASHGALKNFDAAATDAEAATLCDASNVKSFYRLGLYSSELKSYDKALKAVVAGLKLESKNVALLRLKRKIKAAKPALKASPLPSLYNERTEKYGSSREMIRQLKAELSSGSANKNHSALDGMFARLMDPKKFQATIFPGLDKDAQKSAPKTLLELLQNEEYEEEMAAKGIPDARSKAGSVLENVKAKGAKQNQFMDAATEASLWPQIMQEAIAHQVVEVVNRVHKRKHSARGISMAVMCAVACGMDLNEVHGDYIDIDDKMVKMVEQFEEKSGGLLRGGRFTKPGVEEIDQLPMQAMIGLQIVPGLPDIRMKDLNTFEESDGLALGSGYFVLDDFLGEEAYAVIRESVKGDCKRMLKQGRLADVPVLKKAGETTEGGILAGGEGKVAWVGGDELKGEYASVHEIVKAVKSLPKEMNLLGKDLYQKMEKGGAVEGWDAACKVEEGEIMCLKMAGGGSVCITAMQKGDKRGPRIDSGGGASDVGHALSCMYWIGGGDIEGGRSGAVRVKNVGDGRGEVIEAKADRLVVWRSKDVESEIMEVLGANETMYCVHFWITGCITNAENVEASLKNLATGGAAGGDVVKKAVEAVTETEEQK